MKTITNEIKAKYYALYYGQKVLYNGCDTVVVNGSYNWLHPSHVLRLTPLESISDEDATEVSKLLKCKYCKADLSDLRPHLMAILNRTNTGVDGYTLLHISQYLQSKGYALPYLDYSVNDLITLNVIKLK